MILPAGRSSAGNTRSFVSSRGAHELYRRRPRPAPNMPAAMPDRAARPSTSRAALQSQGAGRAGCGIGRPSSVSLVFQPTTISDGLTTPDCAVGAGGDECQLAAATPSTAATEAAATRPPARTREPATPRALARQLRQQSRGHGTRRGRPHVQHDGLCQRAPLDAVLADLEVLVQRGVLDLADLAVRGHGDPQPRHLAERRKRVLWSGCGHERVESKARSTSNTGWVPLPTSMDEIGVEKFARSSGIAPRPPAPRRSSRRRKAARRASPASRAARARASRAALCDALREGVGERHEDGRGIAVGRVEPLDPRARAGRPLALRSPRARRLVPRSRRVGRRSPAQCAPAPPARPRARAAGCPRRRRAAAARAPSTDRRGSARGACGSSEQRARGDDVAAVGLGQRAPIERERERTADALVGERPFRRVEAQYRERRWTGSQGRRGVPGRSSSERSALAGADRGLERRRRRPAARSRCARPRPACRRR